MLKRLTPLAAVALLVALAAIVPPPAVHADRQYQLCDPFKSSLCQGLVALYEFEEDSDYARTSETGGAALFLEIPGVHVGRTTGARVGTYGLNHTAVANSTLMIPRTVGPAGTFTGGFWFKYTAGPSADGRQVWVMAMRDANGNTVYPQLYLDRAAGVTVMKYVVRNAMTGWFALVNSGALSSGTWYHIGFGDYPSPTATEPFQETLWIALNGGTKVIATTSYPSKPGMGDLVVGSNYAAGTFEYGAYVVDQFAVWGRLLDNGERTKLYNSGTALAYPFTN